MSPPKPRCFIIRPIDERSDLVLDLYIRPALDDTYEVVPAGADITVTIKDFVFRYLEDDPLVVAYLGRPAKRDGDGNPWYWNPNVMLEAGFRLGKGKPVIFLRESKDDPDEPLLPFDLTDHWLVTLPDPNREKRKTERDAVIGQIQEYAGVVAVSEQLYGTAFPSTTMRFEGGTGTVTAASDDAAQLFGFKRSELQGMNVSKLIGALLRRMVPRQRTPFEDEQSRLLGEVLAGKKPLANVCIVFGDSDINQGDLVTDAYLPIVTRFLVPKRGPTILDVIYADVSDLARLDADGIIRCRLKAISGVHKM